MYQLKIIILNELSKIIKQKEEKQYDDTIIDLINSIQFDTRYLSKTQEEEEKQKMMELKKKKK